MGRRGRRAQMVVVAVAGVVVSTLNLVGASGAVVPVTAQVSQADDPAVAAFQDGWVHRALRLQERLDRHEPLRNSLVPHSHNSANSTAYGPTLTTLDPNQVHTIGDQLRMGIRGIELDLHWVLHPSGLADGEFAVVLCHGTTIEIVDGLPVHVGCSVDHPFEDGLAEIRDFLTAPGNEEVVLLLYLENQLDDDPTAHARAVAAIEDVLGDLVQPAPEGSGDGTCADAPMDQSRQEVLDGGHQIVIVGDCGPGDWGRWVHERGPLWNESSHTGGYPPFPDCIDSARTEEDYDANFIRHWEDLTQLTALTNGGEMFPITPEVTRNMVACGVDMVGFDKLEPDDGRLEALIWSWAPDEPTHEPDRGCAARHADGRFRMDDCAADHHVSCRDGAGSWIVPEATGPWAEAEAICSAVGSSFAVPPTGWENRRLGAAAVAVDDPILWLPIGGPSDGDPGAPDAGSAGPSSAPDQRRRDPTGTLPASGGGALGAAVVATLAAVLVLRSRR